MLTAAAVDELERQAGERSMITWSQETALELVGSLRDVTRERDALIDAQRDTAEPPGVTGLSS